MTSFTEPYGVVTESGSWMNADMHQSDYAGYNIFNKVGATASGYLAPYYSSGVAQWVKYDSGKIIKLYRLDIGCYSQNPDTYKYPFSISISNDDNSYNTIYTGSIGYGDDVIKVTNIDHSQFRYIKIDFPESTMRGVNNSGLWIAFQMNSYGIIC